MEDFQNRLDKLSVKGPESAKPSEHFARIIKMFKKVLCKYRSQRAVVERQPPAAIPKLDSRM